MTDIKQAFDFCKEFCFSIFRRYDKNNDNILNRKDLNVWLEDQKKTFPLFKKVVEAEFKKMINTIDANSDDNVDRWELFNYCVGAYKPDDS